MTKPIIAYFTSYDAYDKNYSEMEHESLETPTSMCKGKFSLREKTHDYLFY